MPPVIVRYRKILALTLANNAILFTESAIIGHRVQIKMSVDDLNTYFIWKRQSGSSRPVGHFLSDVSGVSFQDILLDSLNKSYTDLDFVSNGLNFSSYIFDDNTDGRTRVGGRVSVNDLVMAYVLYKCYGSSSCPTASVVYNLEDAQAMITSGGVSMSITGAFNDDEASACAAEAGSQIDYGGVDAMFRNMLGTVPLRYFQANGTQIPGLFETNFVTPPSDPSAQGSWNFLENDCLELRVQFTFQQPVAHESINEVGQVAATTVINVGDSFTIRLQILATDTPSGSAAKRVAAIAAIAAASQQTVEAQQAAARAAMVAAAEAQQAVNAAALQQQADTDEYFSILSKHAQQEIYTKNSETIYKNATAALFAAIQYNGADSIIQTARGVAINAAANYAETQIILANLSTRMLMYQFAKENAISTLNGAQIVAASRLLASATAANVTAQVALATAQSNAAIIALNNNTCYSTITFRSQLEVINPSVLLTNQNNLTTASNAVKASLSNFLIAQANQITAFNTLNTTQAVMNNAIILGKPLGIVSGNLNAAVAAESRTKSALLSTNIAFITAIGAESAALNTLLTNTYMAANLSNLLAVEAYNSASSNLSIATSNLSNDIVMNSNVQAMLSLANMNLTSSLTGGASSESLTSTMLGYTAAANSTATVVATNSAALTSKQVLLNAANSNVLATSANLSSILASNAAKLSTFSTTIASYTYTVSTTQLEAASDINTAHINYNIALEGKESAQAALTVAKIALNTATGTPQELALLKVKVANAEAALTTATLAFNNASRIYTSIANSVAEDPNSFAILTAAASQLRSSISTAMNNQLANNLYAALSTQNSMVTVLNGYSVESQVSMAALASAITSGAPLAEIQGLNLRKANVTAAYSAAAVAASAAANAVSVAKAAAAGDPNVVAILEGAALLSYSTSQATAANAAVQEVTAAYEKSAIALQSSLTAQLAYSTAVCALYNGVVGGYNIRQITPLQQTVNLKAYLYAQTVAAAVRAGQVLLGKQASVDPMARTIIDTTLVNLNASAISNSVNSYASTLIAAKGVAASSLTSMVAAQSAYDLANLKLDTEIVSGTSITQIQAAQAVLMTAGNVLASTTMAYNNSSAVVATATSNLASSTAAYTSTLALANKDPLGLAITKVLADTASLATSLSTQIGTIRSAEVVSLASIAYDAQSTLVATGSSAAAAALSTAQSAVLNYRAPAYVLAAIANFSGTSSLQTAPSIPLLTASNIDGTSFDVIISSVGASSYSFTLNGTVANPSLVGTTATFSGLTSNTYTVVVTASNSVGSSTASIRIRTVPIPVPTSLTPYISSITTSSFTAGWSGGLGAVSTFYSLGSTFLAASNPFIVTDLSAATQYMLTLMGSNAGGTTYSLPTPVTTLAIPELPALTNILTSLITASSFSVSWSSSATSYSFVLNGNSYVPSTDNSVSGNISLNGLTPSTEYLLVITASNDAGYKSFPVRVTTTAAPSPPVQVTTPIGVSATAYTADGFTITWSGGDLSTFYTYKINGVAAVPAVDNGVLNKTATFTGLQGTVIVVVTAENPDDNESSLPVSITIPQQVVTMATYSNAFMTSIALDPSNNIYAIDAANSSILKTSSPTFTTLITSTSESPWGICFDASSNMYTTYTNNSNILKNGSFFTNGGSGQITIGLDGFMYVANNHVVNQIDIEGNVKQINATFADGSSLSYVPSVRSGPDGFLYLADANNGHIVKMSTSGVATIIASLPYFRPYDLVVDASGNVYVMDVYGYVYKISAQGVVTKIAGNGQSDGVDGPLLSASMYSCSICIAYGNLWFAEASGNIRKIEISAPAQPINSFTGRFPPPPPFNLSITPAAGGFSVDYSGLFYKDPFYTSQSNIVGYGDSSGTPLYVAGGIRFVGNTAICMATSTDGQIWMPRESPYINGMCQVVSVVYGNGIWVASGTTSDPIVLSTSADGINWIPVPLDPFVGGSAGVRFVNGVFYATGSSPNTNICRSIDGINWEPLALFPGGLVCSVAYGNGIWIAVGNNEERTQSIAISPDGINWTPVDSPFTGQSGQDIAYGNGLWIAVGNSNTGINMATSTDGIVWNPVTASFAFGLGGIIYANGLWVVSGSAGASGPLGWSTSIATSSDGINWNPISNPLRVCGKITYINNVWYAPGFSNDNYTLLTSTDAITWTPTYNNPGTISYTFLIDNVPTTPSTDIDQVASFASGSTLTIVVSYNNNTIGTYSVAVN